MSVPVKTNETPRDLFAEAQTLAGLNPQHAQMIRMARARLHRFRGRSDCVADIAIFAVEAMEREKESADLFAQDMQRKFVSPEASDRRMRQLQEAVALDVPGETSEARSARIGVVYAKDSVSIPIHRAGSALWESLVRNKGRKRPYRAKDDELFAALGLVLLIRGMRWRPAIGGRDGIRSLVAGGESAVREFAHGGQQAASNLLDAAECIYGWQHLKPKPAQRVEWKKALREQLSEFKAGGGGFISAKEARKRFAETHPQFASNVENLATFKVEYTRQQKYLDY